MRDLNGQRAQLVAAIERADSWFRSLDDLPGQLFTSPPSYQREISELRPLGVRASSTLINLAFLGTFSSGKSFLLSGRRTPH